MFSQVGGILRIAGNCSRIPGGVQGYFHSDPWIVLCSLGAPLLNARR